MLAQHWWPPWLRFRSRGSHFSRHTTAWRAGLTHFYFPGRPCFQVQRMGNCLGLWGRLVSKTRPANCREIWRTRDLEQTQKSVNLLRTVILVQDFLPVPEKISFATDLWRHMWARSSRRLCRRLPQEIGTAPDPPCPKSASSQADRLPLPVGGGINQSFLGQNTVHWRYACILHNFLPLLSEATYKSYHLHAIWFLRVFHFDWVLMPLFLAWKIH